DRSTGIRRRICGDDTEGIGATISGMASEGGTISLRRNAWLRSQFASRRVGGGSGPEREVEQWPGRRTRESVEGNQASDVWASRIRLTARQSGERSLIKKRPRSLHGDADTESPRVRMNPNFRLFVRQNFG